MSMPSPFPRPFWNLEGKAAVSERMSHQVTALLSVLQFQKPAMLTNSLHNTLFIKTHKLALF